MGCVREDVVEAGFAPVFLVHAQDVTQMQRRKGVEATKMQRGQARRMLQKYSGANSAAHALVKRADGADNAVLDVFGQHNV